MPGRAAAKLRVSQLAVGTPAERVMRGVRWAVTTPHRMRHPELWDFYLEDRRTRMAIDALLSADDCAVDVGAHIGSMLADIVRLAPQGRHTAVEPVPVKAAGLRRRFPSVQVIEAATSDQPGTATFHIDVNRPGFSGLHEPVEGVDIERLDVQVVTLDDALSSVDRLDFMKIDVEGAELPTLRGAVRLLRRFQPDLLFECAPDSQLEPFGYTRTDLFQYLTEAGYAVYSMVDFVYGRDPMTAESFAKAGVYPFRGFNYLALPTGTTVRRLDER